MDIDCAEPANICLGIFVASVGCVSWRHTCETFTEKFIQLIERISGEGMKILIMNNRQVHSNYEFSNWHTNVMKNHIGSMRNVKSSKGLIETKSSNCFESAHWCTCSSYRYPWTEGAFR